MLDKNCGIYDREDTEEEEEGWTWIGPHSLYAWVTGQDHTHREDKREDKMAMDTSHGDATR